MEKFLLTEKRRAKLLKYKQIRNEYLTLTSKEGNQKMAVYYYLMNKYNIKTIATMYKAIRMAGEEGFDEMLS